MGCLVGGAYTLVAVFVTAAVSLDGTLIHKSGMITGGVSGNQAKAKHWEEKELSSTWRGVRRLPAGDVA